MNVKLWRAAVLMGSHGSVAGAAPMKPWARVWAGKGPSRPTVRQPARPAASSSVEVQAEGARASEFAPSMATRAIRGVEGFTILSVMLYFALGTLAILLGG